MKLPSLENLFKVISYDYRSPLHFISDIGSGLIDGLTRLGDVLIKGLGIPPSSSTSGRPIRKA